MENRQWASRTRAGAAPRPRPEKSLVKPHQGARGSLQSPGCVWDEWAAELGTGGGAGGGDRRDGQKDRGAAQRGRRTCRDRNARDRVGWRETETETQPGQTLRPASAGYQREPGVRAGEKSLLAACSRSALDSTHLQC